MTTEALAAAGLAPTGIAGRPGEWLGRQRQLGGDDLFVVEADEYDQAFLTLHPTVAVVNNVEPDHLECYGSVAALEEAFVEFAGRAETVAGERGRSGRAAGGGAAWAERVWRFGFDADADVRISDVVQQRRRHRGRGSLAAVAEVSRLRLQVPGVHNLRNAAAALGVVDALGGTLGARAEALAEFTGWAGGSSGWASTAAWRWWTTTPTTRRSSRPRSPPRGRRFRAAGSSRCSSPTSTPGPRRMARRWVGRWPRPTWCSSPRSTRRASSRCPG